MRDRALQRNLGSARDSRAVSGDSPEISCPYRAAALFQNDFGGSPKPGRESRALPRFGRACFG